MLFTDTESKAYCKSIIYIFEAQIRRKSVPRSSLSQIQCNEYFLAFNVYILSNLWQSNRTVQKAIKGVKAALFSASYNLWLFGCTYARHDICILQFPAKRKQLMFVQYDVLYLFNQFLTDF